MTEKVVRESGTMIMLRDGKSRIVIHPETHSAFYTTTPTEIFRMDIEGEESGARVIDVSPEVDGWVPVSDDEVRDWIAEVNDEALAERAVEFLNEVRN